MIIETVTVTTTPTTIYSLINQARTEALQVSDSIFSIMFRTAADGTEPVLIEEESTVTPIILLDPANDQPYAAQEDYNLTNCKLSVASGTVLVSITASQRGVIRSR